MEDRFGIFANQNIISDFTGGFDSRIIASALMRVRNYPQENLFTFVFGPPGSREVQLVEEISNKLNLRNIHAALPETWQDIFTDYVRRSFYTSDGEENACNYAPILYANELKSENHTLTLNGLGGELYRDFWWVQEISASKRPANYHRLVETRVLQYEYDYSIFDDFWREGNGKCRGCF